MTVEERFLPVLVFVSTAVIAASSPAPPPRGATGPEPLSGLVHLWAHVHGSTAGEACLRVIGTKFP